MAITAYWYGSALLSAFNGEFIIGTHTIKSMLVTSAYTPNQDTHRYKSSVTNEASGTGYTAGGVTLTSVATNYNAGTNVFKISAANAVWASSTITARYLVTYRDTGTAATSPLLSYVDFGADVSSSNSNFSITWDSAGIVSLTVA